MADHPTAAADRAQPLPIAEALRDRNCADVLGVAVSSLPPGTVLSAGTDNGDGSWTLTAADLDGLTITPPADWFGDATVTVSATARDNADAGAATAITAFGLQVSFGPPPTAAAPVAAPETVAAAAPPGLDEGRTVALDIDVGLSEDDAPGPISVAIGGVPEGATLSAGTDGGDGTWVLDSTALSGLTLTLPAGAPDNITLGIAATAADGTSAAGVLALTVSELPDAAPDRPPLPATGPEPTFEPAFEPEPRPGIEAAPAPAPAPEPVSAPEFVPEPVADAEPAPASPARPGIASPPGVHVPIAYWKLDELLPGTVGDEIGNHHGRSHGVAEGANGGAFDTVDSFDGIDDYIVVPHAPELAPAAGALTVWFNAFAGGQGTLVAKGAPAAGVFLALSIAGRRLRFVLVDGETVHVAQGGAFGATEWNQATVTWGGAGMALYLNGERMAADDFTGGLIGDDAPWLFGAADTGDGGVGDFFHGELDDVAIYAEQLDAATVQRLFRVGVIGLMSDDGAAADEPRVAAGGDSPLSLDAIPVDAEGPANLAALDATDDAEDVAAPGEPAGDVAPEGDSPLDLDAVPAEAEGPESLATLDAEQGIAAALSAQTGPAEVGGGVFVLGAGAGADYFQGGDGWADAVPRPPANDAPAVSLAAGDELEITGGDTLEW